MTMLEVCQLILEVCSIGGNGATCLLGDELVLCIETTVHSKVMKCKLEDTNYEQVYTRIAVLVRDSYAENQMILREEINSFSETSQ